MKCSRFMLVVCLVIQAVSKTVLTEISLAENELGDQGALLVVRQAGPVDVVLVATQMTFILEDQPSKIRSFPIKARVIRVPGIYIYTYI